jgi:hypothetical protein
MLEAQPVAAPVVDGAVGITAVSSRVSKDYVRTKLADGSFQPEEYAFGEGGRLNGALRDPSIDKLRFIDIARVVARSLAAQNYRPAKDLNTEKLLIMIYWGTTIVPESFNTTAGNLNYQQAQNTAGSLEMAARGGNTAAARNAQQATAAALGSAGQQLSMENIQREQTDFKNANLLGYDSEGLIGTDEGQSSGHTGVSGNLHEELLSEIEETRYFVVLLVYDFQVFRKENKHKLLWEARLSINEAHNDFSKALPAMVQYASRYFGQDSHGLLRTRVPEGKVIMGEPKSLGEVEAPEK